MKSPVVVLRRNWWQLLTYFSIALAALVIAFFGGYYKAEYDLGAILGGVSAVEKILAQQETIQSLKKEKLKAQHDQKIENQSTQLLEQQFAELKLEIDHLKRDLALYKSIVNPSKKDSGVYLKKLQIKPMTVGNDTEEKLYQYQIILAQKSKQRSYTRGKVELDFILAKMTDKNRIVDDKGNSIKARNYKFRYYQDIQGKIKVAKDILIKQVKIVIKHSKQKYDNIEYLIDWQDLKETSYVGK